MSKVFCKNSGGESESVAARCRASGVDQGPGQLGLVMAEVRRATSVTVVRAQGVCLLERLGFLGPGARSAVGRRQAILLLERRKKREAQANHQAFVRWGLARANPLE